jgi:NADH:ubiquinone oxidoreductase subunit 3 (subunit A)
MTIMDIIIKILLFFTVFYGAIILTAFISKKIRLSQNNKEKEISDKKTL